MFMRLCFEPVVTILCPVNSEASRRKGHGRFYERQREHFGPECSALAPHFASGGHSLCRKPVGGWDD